MTLALKVPGATPEEIELGLEAALLVFAMAGVTPEQGAYGIGAREMWDIEGFPENHYLYGPAEAHAADAWDDATSAAIAICCAGWEEEPEGAGLILLDGRH